MKYFKADPLGRVDVHCVTKQSHEALVHMILLMAMEERIAGVRCHQVGFHFGSRLDDHHILVNPAEGWPRMETSSKLCRCR